MLTTGFTLSITTVATSSSNCYHRLLQMGTTQVSITIFGHLLYRWITAQGMQDTIIAAHEDRPVTSPELRDQIEQLIQASIEDWLAAEAEQPVWSLAARSEGIFLRNWLVESSRLASPTRSH